MIAGCWLLAVAASAASPADLWVTPPTVKVRLDDGRSKEAVEVVNWAGMRGELEHAQLCIRSRQRVQSVAVTLSPLRDAGSVIAGDALSWRQVGYVNCKKTSRYKSDPGWWPDPLLEVESFTLLPNETQPIWLTVRIPRDARPGTYKGEAKVVAGNRELGTIPIGLTVWDLTLPHRGAFQTAFSFSRR